MLGSALWLVLSVTPLALHICFRYVSLRNCYDELVDHIKARTQRISTTLANDPVLETQRARLQVLSDRIRMKMQSIDSQTTGLGCLRALISNKEERLLCIGNDEPLKRLVRHGFCIVLMPLVDIIKDACCCVCSCLFPLLWMESIRNGINACLLLRHRLPAPNCHHEVRRASSRLPSLSAFQWAVWLFGQRATRRAAASWKLSCYDIKLAFSTEFFGDLSPKQTVLSEASKVYVSICMPTYVYTACHKNSHGAHVLPGCYRRPCSSQHRSFPLFCCWCLFMKSIA